MTHRQLQKIIREVEETRHPDLRERVVKEKEAFLQAELDNVKSNHAMVAAELRDHWTRLTGNHLNGGEPPGAGNHLNGGEPWGGGLWARFLIMGKKLAAGILVIADFPVSVWLWRQALLVGEFWATMIAVLVTLGVAVGCHFALLNFADDPDKPRRSIRLCRTTARIAGIIAVIAAGIIFLMRTASPEMGPLITLLMLTVPGALWILSLTVPTFAGALSAWATFEQRTWWYQHKLVKLRQIMRNIENVLDKIRNGGHEPPSPVGPAALAALFYLIMSFASQGYAEQLSESHLWSDSVPNQSNGANVIGRACEFWTDWSESVDPGQRTEALRRLHDLLGEFVRRVPCTKIRVGNFTDEGFFAQFTELEVPESPSAKCAEHPRSKYAQVFRAWRDFESQNIEEQCLAKNVEARTKFEKLSSEILGKAQMALLHKRKPSGQKGGCTDIVQLVAGRLKVAFEATVIVVATDAVSDCQQPKAIQMQVPQVPSTIQLVFLLIPPRGKTTVHREAWISAWEAAVPGITTLPWVNLSPGFVRFLVQPRSIGVSRASAREPVSDTQLKKEGS